jgi:hypothetical protein
VWADFFADARDNKRYWRPHQALDMKTPAMTCALAAWLNKFQTVLVACNTDSVLMVGARQRTSISPLEAPCSIGGCNA